MRSKLTLAVLLATTIAGVATAQAPRETPLGRAVATYPGEFSLLRSVRELANGSVLAVDPIDKVFIRIDPTMQRSDTLGRQGRGPGEYVQPDAVWPLAADSSLLVDLGANRLTIVDPAGRLGATTPIMSAGGGDAPPSLMLPAGIDRRGGIWFRGMPGQDSLDVRRYDRATKRAAVMGKVSGPPMHRTESGESNSRSVRASMIPYGAQDGWTVTPAGTLYIVRAPAYRVEVIPSGGAKVIGAPVAVPTVRITDAEKKEWVAESARNGGISVGIENRDGQQTFSLGRSRSSADQIAGIRWPAQKPPFDAGGLLVDTRDRLWVRRHEPAGRGAAYDVFDQRGARVGTVRLPASRTVIGFGARGVYVSHVDDDDIAHLERYALPL